MGFPDRIARTVDVARPPERVWTALTTPEGLAAWFGRQARIDLRPGGAGSLSWEDHTTDFRVERIEEPHVFGFTWRIHGLPDADPRRTYVEFTLEPTGTGTRLTVVETGFAQLSPAEYEVSYSGNVKGWAAELDELVSYLDGV
ncbi:SRPBCC domain-containing protein [Pseudonocardia oroxyli]|uniref:Uncharacterized conserved protein YndB, AHSA1/START domain n=1 Tax=Pseudonocardia oroxyli TaxID=366584 RepID=A0A1G7W5X1_PSEOR|nr:SRPBCC domain-containing protein [Pseudonocardia oroxyli]SDG67384.1 Uncharacterized conserved protein YndB, AHSA1/START domain [Pseudonocardia oroxyli]